METVNVNLLFAESGPQPFRSPVLKPRVNIGNHLPFIQLIFLFFGRFSVPELIPFNEKVIVPGRFVLFHIILINFTANRHMVNHIVAHKIIFFR